MSRWLLALSLIPLLVFLIASDGHAETTFIWEDFTETFYKGAIDIFPGGSASIEVVLPKQVLEDKILQLTVKGNADFAKDRFKILCNLNRQADFFAVDFWVMPGENKEAIIHIPSDELNTGKNLLTFKNVNSSVNERYQLVSLRFAPSIVSIGKVLQNSQAPAELPKEQRWDLRARNEIDFGRYHAIIIGIDEYRHLGKLDAAVFDAKTIAEILREKYGFSIITLINEKATRKGIIDSLEHQRKRLLRNDNLLVYYAGHGTMDDATMQGYWQPVDAEKESPANWISSNEIINPLRASKAKHVLVISDSCFAKALMDKKRSTTPGTNLDATPGEELFNKISVYADLTVRRILVSGGLAPVKDLGGDGHSIFASALISILKSSNSVVNVESFIGQLKEKVMFKTSNKQIPEYSPIADSADAGGDFIFVPK